ncbi:Transcriptional regulator CBF1 [Lecanosticta acicola]|uniref:Transcriptional regulator CBF1 n=1 Tax=Lecanosticta acicola TaxID=111012 RepID=A0AAI9E5A0_9PEZI|nr:Transcriptional regulator CBF1 [Lecanosticta acicola]
MAALASKRKRESSDMPSARPAPHMGGSDFEDQYLHGGDGMEHGDLDTGFAAALAQHNAGTGEEGDPQQDQGHYQGPEQSHQGGPASVSDTAAAAMAQYHTMTVPQSTEQAFMAQPTEQPADRGATATSESANPNAQPRNSSFSDFDISQNNEANQNGGSGSPTGASASALGGAKPQVGTEEWHKVRRDNHKEVERRRRETINEGINELAKIVPGCEKNKGSILARAVQFITQLKENETQNIEKWTLEKLLTEQAIAELSSSCDKLKAECQRAWAECEQWKKAAQRAGISIDTDEKADADGEDGE